MGRIRRDVGDGISALFQVGATILGFHPRNETDEEAASWNCERSMGIERIDWCDPEGA